MVVYTYALDEKKTSSRDVNNAESSADFALAKIPLYVIPNTPPGAEPKIPVTFIRSPYQSTYLNAAIKDGKQYKYGFYAPYKVSKLTKLNFFFFHIMYRKHNNYVKLVADAFYKKPIHTWTGTTVKS